MTEILLAIDNGVASTTEAVGDVLVNNLPAVLGVFGALIALGLIIRVIKKLIGRRV